MVRAVLYGKLGFNGIDGQVCKVQSEKDTSEMVHTCFVKEYCFLWFCVGEGKNVEW